MGLQVKSGDIQGSPLSIVVSDKPSTTTVTKSVAISNPADVLSDQKIVISKTPKTVQISDKKSENKVVLTRQRPPKEPKPPSATVLQTRAVKKLDPQDTASVDADLEDDFLSNEAKRFKKSVNETLASLKEDSDDARGHHVNEIVHVAPSRLSRSG